MKRSCSAIVIRTLVIVASSIVCFGPFYLYDTLVSTQAYLMGQPCNNTLSISENASKNCCSDCVGFNALEYNVLLGLPLGLASGAGIAAGFIIDRYGFRIFLMLTAMGPILGAFLRAMALRHREFHHLSYGLMLSGSLVVDNVFTILCIMRIYVCTRWFRGPSLGFSVGLTMSVAMCGSVLAFYMNVPLTQHIGLETVYWCAILIGGTSAIGATVIVLLDVFAGEYQDGLVEQKGGPRFSFSNVRYFQWPFWVCCIIIGLVWLLFNGFLGNSVSIQTDVFGVEVDTASFTTGLNYVINIIVPPISGTLATRFNMHGSLCLFGALLHVAGFSLIVWPIITPIAIVLFISSGFAIIYPVLQTLLPNFVGAESLATSTGIMMFSVGAAIGIGDILVGFIANSGETRADGWVKSAWFWLAIALVETGLILVLIISNVRSDKKIFKRRITNECDEDTEALLDSSDEEEAKSFRTKVARLTPADEFDSKVVLVRYPGE